MVASKGCLRKPKAQEAQSLSASDDYAKSSIPEPTKEGEGKGYEHKSAEALRLLNVRQLVCPLGGAGIARHVLGEWLRKRSTNAACATSRFMSVV